MEVNFATAQAIRDAKKALGREKESKGKSSEGSGRSENKRWKKLTRRGEWSGVEWSGVERSRDEFYYEVEVLF